jgi:hypothetical protein
MSFNYKGTRWLLATFVIATCIVFTLFLVAYFSPLGKLSKGSMLMHIPMNSVTGQSSGSLTTNYSGLPNSAIHFNGSTNYLVIDDSLANLSENFTFCFWVQPQQESKRHTLFLKGENCPDGNSTFVGMSYEITLSDNNEVSMRLFNSPGNHNDEYIEMITAYSLDLSEWQQISISYSNALKKFSCYVNGEPIAATTKSRTYSKNFISINKSNSPLKIGADENYCGRTHQFQNYFVGNLCDMYLFDRVLSRDDIQKLLPRSILHLPQWFTYCVTSYILLALLLFAIHFQKEVVNIITRVTSTPATLVVFLIILTMLLGNLYFHIISDKMKFKDVAYFGGDTWEYQSMAVNFAKGHGLHRFGGLEEFSTYKFDHFDSALAIAFSADAGKFNAYRTPGYPLFLGMIYKLNGIDVIFAQKVQLILIIIVACMLPWIGYHYWGIKGLASGVLTGYLFLLNNYTSAERILTESLSTFMIALLIIAFIFFENKENKLRSGILGFLCGMALLTKGNVIFMPLIFLGYFGYTYLKLKRKSSLHNVVTFAICLTSTIAVWSIYATINEKSLVILSTQTANMLMDGNNERSIIDGAWHPEWTHTDSFYKNDGLKGYPAIIRVANFYIHNISLAPTIFMNKLLHAYNYPFLLVASFLMLINFFISRLTVQIRNSKYFTLTLTLLIISFLMTTDYLYSIWPFDVYQILKLVIIVLFHALFFVSLPQKKPLIFTFLFINFIALTLITFGDPRFIEVIDYLFTFWAIYLGISIISNLNDNKAAPIT